MLLIQKLFKYILDDDEDNALVVLEPEHIYYEHNSTGDTALHLACSKGFIKLAKKLLNYGANPYDVNKKKENPLSIANREGNTEILVAIYKSDHEVTLGVGSYLIDAVKEDEVGAVRLYCKKAGKAIIKATMERWTSGIQQNSLLHLAVNNNSNDMIQLLIEYGADTKYENALGQKPQVYFRPCSPEIEKVTESSNLRGRAGEYYLSFIKYLAKTNLNTNSMETIANWDGNHSGRYFIESEQSTQYATDFLNAFWGDSKNMRLTIELHQYKVARTQQKANNQKIPHPACISFIALTIDGKKYCLIALSYNFENGLAPTIKLFVESYNKTKSDVEFILLGGTINYIQEALKSILGDKVSAKGCTEKYYVSILTKLYLHLGRALQVQGVSNCSLYPYKHGEIPQGSVSVNPLFLDNDLYVLLILCCNDCRTNKPAVAKILKTAQFYHANHLQESCENRDRLRRLEVSPLGNSIKSQSSLLSKFSIYSPAETVASKEEPNSSRTNTPDFV